MTQPADQPPPPETTVREPPPTDAAVREPPSTETAVRESPSTETAVRDRRGPGPRRRGARPSHAAEVARAARIRQREEFGGVSWLSALVGWLAAAGVTAIGTGVLAAGGAVLAVTEVGRDVAGSEAETIGLFGGIALLVVLAIAYWFGGYAAGRMARFDGGRQGIAVFICGILAAGVIALLTLIGGAEYNVLDRLNLPRIPLDNGTLTNGGLFVLLASIVVTLVAAMLGGKAGERFHRRVDRAGVAD